MCQLDEEPATIEVLYPSSALLDVDQWNISQYDRLLGRWPEIEKFSNYRQTNWQTQVDTDIHKYAVQHRREQAETDGQTVRLQTERQTDRQADNEWKDRGMEGRD